MGLLCLLLQRCLLAFIFTGTLPCSLPTLMSWCAQTSLRPFASACDPSSHLFSQNIGAVQGLPADQWGGWRPVWPTCWGSCRGGAAAQVLYEVRIDEFKFHVKPALKSPSHQIAREIKLQFSKVILAPPCWDCHPLDLSNNICHEVQY